MQPFCLRVAGTNSVGHILVHSHLVRPRVRGSFVSGEAIILDLTVRLHHTDSGRRRNHTAGTRDQFDRVAARHKWFAGEAGELRRGDVVRGKPKPFQQHRYAAGTDCKHDCEKHNAGRRQQHAGTKFDWRGDSTGLDHPFHRDSFTGHLVRHRSLRRGHGRTILRGETGDGRPAFFEFRHIVIDRVGRSQPLPRTSQRADQPIGRGSERCNNRDAGQRDAKQRRRKWEHPIDQHRWGHQQQQHAD